MSKTFVMSYPLIFMHHSEIGHIIEIIEEYLLGVDELYPVKIESYRPSQRAGLGIPVVRGIRLVTIVINSRITIEIDSLNEDANQSRICYYSSDNDDRPSLSFASHTSDLCFDSFKNLIRTLIQASKGKISLSEIQEKGFIGRIQVLPE
jgi:hypothetical protein